MSNTRRGFVRSVAAASLASSAMAGKGIPKRKLGKTGLEVSILGLGGAPVGNMVNGKEAVNLVRRCVDLGITYFDTAAAGAYGLSQVRYGEALKDVRDRVVVATKTRHRTATQAQLDLDQSLSNLKTDWIDLYQVHNVINQEDIEFIFGPKGVMEMIEKARKQGKIRFVGFTGHTSPATLNAMMERHNFATVLLPLSATDGANQQKSFEKETLPLALKKGMGVIAMKTLGAGRIVASKAATVEECLRYTWSLPVSTAIVGIDQIAHLETNVALALSARPMSAAERERLQQRLRTVELARLEPWKSGPA
jgi:aryl-alcohol dehydrogenase-like predicted oxidoreductase